MAPVGPARSSVSIRGSALAALLEHTGFPALASCRPPRGGKSPRDGGFLWILEELLSRNQQNWTPNCPGSFSSGQRLWQEHPRKVLEWPAATRGQQSHRRWAEGVDLGTWWTLLGVSQFNTEGNAGSPLFKTSRLATFASHLLSQEIQALPFLRPCLGRTRKPEAV